MLARNDGRAVFVIPAKAGIQGVWYGLGMLFLSSCPERRALSVAAETGKCYSLRLCRDKLRPAFRMVLQEPAEQFGSGPRWSKKWWRG